MHISALQIPHSSHQDFEISPLAPASGREQASLAPGQHSSAVPSKERCLSESGGSAELVANPVRGIPSKPGCLPLAVFANQVCRFFPFLLALFPSPDLGLTWVHVLLRCKSAQLR